MKKLLLLPAVAALSLSFSTPVLADNVAQNMCEYVHADDKKRLRSLLKAKKLKIRFIFKEIECNGKNLLEFAAASNSVDTGSLIISKLPKKAVSANLASLSGELAEAANKRIGG